MRVHGLPIPAEAARHCLEQVGLGSRLHHKPNQLSSGQQQRVAIARAQVNTPKIILGDEPTGALASKTSGEIMALFAELNKQGITIVLVTHEKDVAAAARRIVTFRDGRIIDDTWTQCSSRMERLAS